jgi:RimJ/RimL family protein N-acetyltransferase
VTTPPEYPRELVQDVKLRNGSYAHIRPIRPDDAPRLQELYSRLSRETAYHRFFTVMKRLPPDWAQILATVDYHRRLALVAEHDGAHGVEIVGVGRYEPTDEPDTVEVAFVVQDGWQNQGLGTILVREVLDAADARGMLRFRAYVLADNRRMLDLIRRFGQVHERKTAQGVTELLFTRRAERAGATRARE